MIVASIFVAGRRPWNKGPGFRRKYTLFEVCQDLLARVELEKNYYCVDVHGKHLILTYDSLFVFREDIPALCQIRFWAVWLVEWRWMNRAVLVVIMLNCVVMSLPASYDRENASQDALGALRACNVLTIMLFTVECVLNVIARGLIFSNAPDRCYLRIPLNWIDFLVVVAGITDLIATSGTDYDTTTNFILVRTICVLRPLRTIHALPHLRMIMNALVESARGIGRWLIIVIVIFTIFAIQGQNLFPVVYWQRCRLTEAPVMSTSGAMEWPIDSLQPRFCGGRYECVPTAAGNRTYCGSPVSALDGTTGGYNPWFEVRNNVAADYGYTGFHSFPSAFLTIFEVSAIEGWTDILYRYQDGKGSIVAVIFFMVIVVFSGLILMNIMLAILWERFYATVEREMPVHISHGLADGEIIPDDILQMKLNELIRTVGALEAKRAQQQVFRQLDSADRSLGMKNICYSVCTNVWFQYVMLTVILFNAVILGFDSYPPHSSGVLDILEKFNLLCTIIFVIEVLIKWVGMGMSFFDDQFNIFDFILVIASLVEYMSTGESTVSAVRAARLLRLLKVVEMTASVRVLLLVLQKAIVPTYNFCILLCLLLYCLSLLGLQMFFPESDDEQPDFPRFDTIGWALMSCFSLVLGQRWNRHMHIYMKIHGASGLIFFLLGFILGNLILMSLFLGIFAAAFTQAREELLLLNRRKLLEFRMAAPEQEREVADSFDMETLETLDWDMEDSPRFPIDIWRRRLGPPKTEAKGMTILRMMRVKRDAISRRLAVGEKPTFKPKPHPASPASVRWGMQSQTGTPQKHSTQMLPLPGATAEGQKNARRGVTFSEQVADQALPPPAAPALLPEAAHSCTPPPLVLDVAEEREERRDSEALAPPPPRWMDEGWHRARPPPAVEAEAQPPPRCDDERGHLVWPPPATEAPALVHSHWADRSRHHARPPLAVEVVDRRSPRVPALQLEQRALPPGFPPSPGGGSGGSGSGLRRRRCAAAACRKVPPDFRELYGRACASTAAHDSRVDAAAPPVPPTPAVPAVPAARAAATAIAATTAAVAATSPAGGSPSGRRVRWDEERPRIHPPRLELAGSHAAPPLVAEVPEPHEAASGDDKEVRKSEQLTISQSIAFSPYFEPSVLIMIVISSACLAVESPYNDPGSVLMVIFIIIDKTTVFAFTAEMLVKMCAFGICRKPSKPGMPPGYFRVGWNWIDFTSVVSGLFDIALEVASISMSSLRLVRLIRLLRVLRPLRLVKRHMGVRVLVEALIASLPTLLNMVIVALLLYVGFAIAFVNMLKGELYHCSLDPTGELRPDIATREDCIDAGGGWESAESNFDHIGNSIITLVHVGTGEGWIDVLLSVVNSVGVDHQPRKGERFHFAFLIAFFVALSNIILLNLFIGVLTDQYMCTKAEFQGVDLITSEEREWIRMQREVYLNPAMLAPEARLPGECCLEQRERLRRVVESRVFDSLIVLCILTNTVLLCLSHPTQTEGFRSGIWLGSLVCVVVFNVEAALKVFVFWKQYFKDFWNVFDFTIAIGSDVSLLADLISDGSVTHLLRIFRILSVLRLARRAPFLKVITLTLWSVIPGLFNVVMLLSLIFFMYACLGVSIFGTVPLTGDANFHSFGDSLLLLFRAATGERWHVLMYDAARHTPQCTTALQSASELEAEGPRGCGSVLAYPFFVSFVAFVAITLMNLVVAVVLDGFQEVNQHETLKVFRKQMADLYKSWKRLDDPFTGYLPLEDLVRALLELPEPVGFRGQKRKHVLHQMRYTRLWEGQRVHFRDVVLFCAKRSCLWMAGEYERDIQRVHFEEDLLERWNAQWPDLERSPDYDSDALASVPLIAHVIIARWVVAYINKERAAWAKESRQAKSALKKPAPPGPHNPAKVNTVRLASGLEAEGPPLAPSTAPPQQALAQEEQREERSMLVTQLEPPRRSGVEKLSPLPWPPPMPLAGAGVGPSPLGGSNRMESQEAVWRAAAQTAARGAGMARNAPPTNARQQRSAGRAQ